MVLQAHPSGRLVRIELALDASDLIAQTQSLLLESSHQQFIERGLATGAVNHGVEIAVFDAQIDQPTFG